jgi:hypothetical protein
MMKLVGDLFPRKILLYNFTIRRILMIALAISTIGVSSTIVMSAAHAGCTSHEQCPNDPNSGFNSPEQAAATPTAAAAQPAANAPSPGPISPLAVSIPTDCCSINLFIY